jgi:hypothetical protein
MLTFPTLKTGSVTQYPATASQSFSTEVLQFMGGDEQRYLTSPGPLLSWSIQLTNLDDAELHALESFFLGAAGRYKTFSFTDPSTGTAHPNCSVATDILAETFTGELRSALTLLIHQGRS